jgi:hypothetical protein
VNERGTERGGRRRGGVNEGKEGEEGVLRAVCTRTHLVIYTHA